MVIKQISLLSLFIVTSCAQINAMEQANLDAQNRMIQKRMAYIQTTEYKTWTSLENTKGLMSRFNTPEMSIKINSAREQAQATSEYQAYTDACEKYLALKIAS